MKKLQNIIYSITPFYKNKYILCIGKTLEANIPMTIFNGRLLRFVFQFLYL